jgi:gamma-glutamyltranspeptidase/glutathione hydrolase
MGKSLGIAASGHQETSRAAGDILEAGGNAFDAALGALCMATVAEPMLLSLGGGGFLMARPGSGPALLYDFFCQTPARQRPGGDIDFYPIMADFGTALQEFHIGMGSMAVPGVVAGLFEIHRDLGRMPMSDIVAPAIEQARKGVVVDEFSHYISQILEPIVRASPDAFALYDSPSRPGDLIRTGESQRNPALAEAFGVLVREGPDVMYRGEWAQQIDRDCRERGGQIVLADLEAYRVERRKPVSFRYRGAQCAINPPPSPGGCLVAFALGLLTDWLGETLQWGSSEHLAAIVRSMRAAGRARTEFTTDHGNDREQMEQMLDERTLSRWRQGQDLHSMFSRGTTHISVADVDGNLASLTASNGEGCAYVLPGTGIMMNNMLGEEDLNPGGFHRWREGSRLASMMSPAVAELADGTRIALGSGGSNRIRSAILQVLINLLDFELPLGQAVAAPRIHLEEEKLSIESGFSEETTTELRAVVPEIHEWPGTNLFFGGVHTVSVSPNGVFRGAGDPRRGGVVVEAFAS